MEIQSAYCWYLQNGLEFLSQIFATMIKILKNFETPALKIWNIWESVNEITCYYISSRRDVKLKPRMLESLAL